MSATITKQTDTEVTLTITVTPAEMAPLVTHTFDNLRPKVKAAGFRPGKAPDAIVERELGPGAVQQEVLDEVLQHTYADAVRDHNLPVIAPPSVQLTKFVPYTELEYTATVEIMPAVKLPDYKKLKARRSEVKVAPADIDKVIEDLRKRAARKADVTRAAKLGDEVTFDFAGTLKGEPVPGATSENYKLELGSKSFIPGFEEELVGLASGESKVFKITFPKDYQEATLAGQEVDFTVKVAVVTETTLPEVDAAFAKEVGELDSVEALRTDIEKTILVENSEQAEKQFEQAVLDEILTKSELKIPSRLADQQISRLKSELEQNLAYSGLDLEKYAQISGKTVADIEAELKPEAEKRVGYAMLLTEIAKAENLTILPEELEDEIDRLRDQYKDPSVLSELSKPEVREDIYNHLLSSKTIQKILSYLPE
jgi:trigger factor